jgi:hypothetical protein
MTLLRFSIVVLVLAFSFTPFSLAEDPAALRNGLAWSEDVWPFPLDQWGVGRAFLCHSARCGPGVNLFIRAKPGFCNCAKGVSDDAELKRIGDTDLISSEPLAVEPGRIVRIGWLNGRLQLLQAADRKNVQILSIAANYRCDVIVAIATTGQVDPGFVSLSVIEFLNTDLILDWAEKALGL